MAMRLLLAAAFGWAGLVSLAFGQNPTPTPRTAASGKTVDWPGVSMTARGNESVAGRIKRSWGSLSYVEYGFAKRLGFP